MERYIALLRGINVSGQKLIKMEHLRQVFTDMGFKNVSTYIQSGNVFFETRKTDSEKLQQKIENQLKETYGFEAITFIRTIPEIADVIKHNPFKKETSPADNQPYVIFLHNELTKEQAATLISFNNDIDMIAVHGREVYHMYKKGEGKSVFATNFMEKKIKIPGTSRNWLTVNKFLEL